jgi:DUF2997 family protein
MQEIEVTIDAKANVFVETNGFIGKECDAIHKVVEAVLGEQQKTLKPEYHAPVVTKHKTKLTQRG